MHIQKEIFTETIIEEYEDLIKYCNENSGFISFILTLITIIISILAIIISIKVALLPYKKNIKIYTMLEKHKERHQLNIVIVNIGITPVYLEDVTIKQKIMNPLSLGCLDNEYPIKKRILNPNIPNEYIIIFENYNETKFDHKSYPIELDIRVSGKSFKTKIDWVYG